MELNPTGAVRDPEDKRDILFSSILPPTAVEYPRKLDLRKDIWFKAFKQKYGSCVGGSGRYIIQYYREKWYDERKLRSDRFIYGISKSLDGHPESEGTWPRICLMGMTSIGAPELERWEQNNPPSPTHGEFVKSPPQEIREEAIQGLLDGGIARVIGYQELKRALNEWGPVMVSLRVLGTYDDEPDDGKIQPSDGSGARGNHENIAVGYDDDAYNGQGAVLVLNQWGTGWADSGYAWIPMNYDPSMNFPLFDMWGITDLIDTQLTSGAPINLGYPIETVNPFVTQKFGDRPEYYAQFGMKGHNGIDFRTKDGNKFIIATDDGEVLALNHNDGAYGKSVRLRHAWGMSIYAHNSQFLIEADSAGQPRKVKKGERIAIAGATGTEAEHCHFGIRINGVKNPGYFDWVDPSKYFGKVNMTKFFRVQQGNTLGILVVEGFGGSLIWEDSFGDYQKLLQISGMTMSNPLILLPAGNKFRVQDGQKAGILLVGSNGGPLIFENDWTEYQTLLQISGMSMQSPLVNIPS